MSLVNKKSEVVDMLEIMFELCLKRKTEVLNKMDITEIEYNFFMCIEKCNDLNIMQLAQKMDLAQAKISRMTEKFIKKGYLVREVQKTDHRSVKLILTQFGKDMHNYAIENKCMGEARIKNILHERKYKRFKKLLRKIIDNYSE